DFRSFAGRLVQRLGPGLQDQLVLRYVDEQQRPRRDAGDVKHGVARLRAFPGRLLGRRGRVRADEVTAAAHRPHRLDARVVGDVGDARDGAPADADVAHPLPVHLGARRQEIDGPAVVAAVVHDLLRADPAEAPARLFVLVLALAAVGRVDG